MNNDELVDEMVQRLGSEIKGLLADSQAGQVAVGSMELLVRQKLWHFGAQAMGVLLEATDAALVAGRPVHDRPTRTVVTLFGAVDVTRSRCVDGSYPLDEALGLHGQQGWTVSVQEAVSLLGCESGFQTVSDLMQRLLGLCISRTRAEEIAEQAGRRAADVLESAPAPREHDASGKALVLATDGCQAPERDGWHEVKVAVVYTSESRAKTAGGRGKLLAKEYLASLDPAQAWGQQLRQAAGTWRVEKAKRVVMMGDGAPWIWNLADEHFPGAVEIVDFFHVVEHLWDTGEALFGDRQHSTATKGWVRHNRRQLRRGRADLVIASIERGQARASPGLSGERAAIVRRNLEYFRTNQHRMRYDQYRRWRLPIGTGAVEGSCKFVVQSRFKKPGARWSDPGLRQMLALKLARLNGQWETLWPHLRLAG
jgi:hypothetical protein